MGGCVLDISAHTLKTPWTMKQPCSHRDQSSCTDLPQSIRGKCPPVSLARSKGEKNPRNIRSTKSRSVLQALSLPWALQHQLIWSKVWTSRGRYHFSCDVSWPDTVNDGDPKHLLSKKNNKRNNMKCGEDELECISECMMQRYQAHHISQSFLYLLTLCGDTRREELKQQV